MNPADVNKILGEPIDKKIVDKSNYIQWYNNGIKVYFTTKNNDVLEVWKIDAIYNPTVKDPAKTSQGIDVNSTIGRVFDTYGQDGYTSGDDGSTNYIDYNTKDNKFILRFALKKGERLSLSTGLEYISLINKNEAVRSQETKKNNNKTMIAGIEKGMTTSQVTSILGGYDGSFDLTFIDKRNKYGETVICEIYEKYDAVIVFAARDGVIVLDVVPISEALNW